MTKRNSLSTFLWLLAAPLALAQQPTATAADRAELGKLANGATVAFVRSGSEDWGIEISGGGAPSMTQPKPAQIEVFAGGERARQLAVGYQSVKKEGDAVVAMANVAGEGKAAFAVEDRWTVSGTTLSLRRKVSVTTAEDNAGFYSAIQLSTASTVKWEDANCLVPGLTYGNAARGGSGRGGAPASGPRRYSLREDLLSAPMLSVMFQDGNWAAVLDPAPKGDTTAAETAGGAATIIDERIMFGALGAQEAAGGGAELGFWLPGTTVGSAGGFGRRGGAGGTDAVQRRYHPVKAGFTQSYQVAFRFGKSETFRDMEREAWRWAWANLKPKVTRVDIELVRKSLADHLADHVVVVDDRAGVPFVIDAVSGKPGSFRPGGRQREQPNEEVANWAKSLGIDADPKADELALWPKIVMGFCGKNVEVADQLLIEATAIRARAATGCGNSA